MALQEGNDQDLLVTEVRPLCKNSEDNVMIKRGYESQLGLDWWLNHVNKGSASPTLAQAVLTLSGPLYGRESDAPLVRQSQSQTKAWACPRPCCLLYG